MKKTLSILVLLFIVLTSSIIVYYYFFKNNSAKTIETLGINYCVSEEDSEQWKDCKTLENEQAVFVINEEKIVVNHIAKNEEVSYLIKTSEIKENPEHEKVMSYMASNSNGDIFNIILNENSKMINFISFKDHTFYGMTYYIK